ncbi:MAG: 16S rRNA (guanine(966)-N(2))-methyltransferase RsmD [Planctomycetes bacterium]|nr:16S rRNA (guanine(966)-N(2))-methyltransferase RsmD [Planctomycetota bacterium]
MLRIIAGEFRSRHIQTPDGGETTRPLPDRVRVAVFNMLHGHIEGQSFFDVFAGTGAFGLEALSRGAKEVVFVEKDRAVTRLIERNIETLGVADRCEVFQGDALGAGALSRCPRPVHVVFFDPPYPLVEDPASRERVFEQFARCVQLLDDEGFAILRTPWPFVDHEDEDTGETDDEGEPIIRRRKTEASLKIPGAKGPETHAYGSTAVHWYARA